MIDPSKFKDPYVCLAIPDTNMYVQVKLDEEGVVVDIFGKDKEDEGCIVGTWKLYQEMEDGCEGIEG